MPTARYSWCATSVGTNRVNGQCLQEHVQLLDGTVVCVRLLHKRDMDAVVQLHERLTAEEQYLRFFVAHPPYLETFARSIVECNCDQWALGAFDSGRLIGVANYVVSSTWSRASPPSPNSRSSSRMKITCGALRRPFCIALQRSPSATEYTASSQGYSPRTLQC
jgi:hypothetical protein